jgi:hypothetical protein
MRYFPASQFANAPLGVRAVGRSLFLPDIELARSSRNARAAGIFGLFRRHLAVIFGIHPDIGANNRETGSHMTAHTTTQSSRTAESVVDRKEAVSAGILSPIFNVPGLCRQ